MKNHTFTYAIGYRYDDGIGIGLFTVFGMKYWTGNMKDAEHTLAYVQSFCKERDYFICKIERV